MKYYIIPLFFLLFACTSDPAVSENEKTDSEEESTPQNVLADFTLSAEQSSATWERVLDQKSMKKKVKMFGAMVDVEMGAVNLTMNGEVTPVDGSLKTTNDLPKSGVMHFDMATFKFAEDRGSGLFDVKKYPTSELVFEEFEMKATKGSDYTAKIKLTIQKHSESYSIPVQANLDGNTWTIHGEFTFNTLDFPLRDKAEQSVVNKDEITVVLNFKYDKKTK
ncbi:MAG: hypothetical protein A3D92_14980 [Bacteroidetes bacterium RIFCSPHIGHO2_02_FULL_44_7]|nr:MAG: hypothetical protein A3D92_14980 [Bacteroidetes bacterium RIFCSPHIGHO2_02_FULL_44_7]